MAVRTEVFAATHDGALAHADALDAGEEPAPAHRLQTDEVSPLDLEVLGEIAARAVRYGTGDLELADVDLDHEGLFRLPPFLREVLTELGTGEDPELVGEVALEWSRSEGMAEVDGQALLPLVHSLIELVRAAEEADLDVYQWVQLT